MTTLLKTGTLLHESSGAHARQLARVLDRYTVDKAAVAARLPPRRVLFPCCFYPDVKPTKVVRMNLEHDLADNLRRELRLKSKIAASFSDASVGTYFPLSTMFENSVMFVPSAQRFYKSNRDMVPEHFPEVETPVINAFVVPKGKRPYGTHSPGSIALQIPSLSKKGLGYPKKHVSFHCALTPTPLDRQPFVIFEDAEVEAPNLAYVYQKLASYGLTPEEQAEVDKAFYLYTEGKLSEVDTPTVRDFMMARFWEKKHAQLPPSPGYYWDSKVGDALVFDNHRPHGDSTLALASEDRVTIDFRCFSKVLYPPGMTGGLDFIVDPEERKYQIKRKRMAVEFLLLTLGYQDMNEFLRVVFGSGHDGINPFDLVTDLQFGVYNKTRYHLLDQNLDGHYERCEQTYSRIERDGEYVLPERAMACLKALSALEKSV